jgi:HisJ family histidinol phosphate phosphatase
MKDDNGNTSGMLIKIGANPIELSKSDLQTLLNTYITDEFYGVHQMSLKAYGRLQGYAEHSFVHIIETMKQAHLSCQRIDTLGHVTYMHRYVALGGSTYAFSDHKDSLAHLFAKMISREIALEINVSTVCKGLGFSMPDQDILKLYRECGGRLITIGTDAHSPRYIGECVEYGFDAARKSGLFDVLVIRDGKKTYTKI